MEQSPSSEANSHSASQEIPCILWNPKVLYPVNKSLPIPIPYVMFRNQLDFYSDELLSPHPTPKLEDHILSAVRDCLFLHPPPEKVACHGDRDPQIIISILFLVCIFPCHYSFNVHK
jgi:hypothetical protein